MTDLIVVVGAGISGLVAAWQLARQGKNVLVVESETRAGGCIRSESVGDFVIDYGPNTALDTKPCIRTIVENLDLISEFQYASEEARNRYILRDGKLNALPTTPVRFLTTRHFSWKAKARLFLEPFIPAHRDCADVSLSHFVERRLGREFLDYAIDPFVAGIYAGDPQNLSVRSAFPKLWALEQRYGSILVGAVLGARERKRRQEVSKSSARMFSFRGGMQTLTDRIAQRLEGKILLSHAVQSLESMSEGGFRVAGRGPSGQSFSLVASRVILALPAYRAAELVAGIAPDAAEALASLVYPPVTVVFHGFEKRAPIATPLDGFGFLIPKAEKRRILGSLWSSTIFPGRAPGDGAAFTTFVGGARQPQETEGGNVEQKAWGELAELLRIAEGPTLTRSFAWRRAIPQYRVGHHDIVARLERAEASIPGLHFLSNYRGGISMSDCIANATALAETLACPPGPQANPGPDR